MNSRDHRPDIIVTYHCVLRFKQRRPWSARISDDALREILLLGLKIAQERGLVFPDPAREDQTIYVVGIRDVDTYISVCDGYATTALVPPRSNRRGKYGPIRDAAQHRRAWLERTLTSVAAESRSSTQ